MQIYLVRHAIAEPRGVEGIADADRALTKKGIQRMRKVVCGLATLGVRPDLIMTSPLVRAVQTADLLTKLPDFSGAIERVDALSPGGDPHEILRLIAKHQDLQSIALVGHEPDLGDLAARLLNAGRESFMLLKKGGVACIQIDEFDPLTDGLLQWLTQPGALRRLR